MSTRSIIAIVIKSEDKGRVITPNLDVLGKPINSNFANPEFHDTTLEQGIISIYHHWDGYPTGVGATLLEEFNDYEKALNLMGFGDASSINGVPATFYNSWRPGEDWSFTQPKQYENEDTFTENYKDDVFIEYIYLFKDGKWWVYSCYADNPEWEELAKVLEYDGRY